ncbi:hypothetical protein ACGFYY_30480 [Streptomyces sp. NPDC048331]|uniref:hypothetical protein n=1 Tax=Streptomyces sp. NPDC048331 TaxID=3365534 RepID=UPI003719A690
MPTRTLPSNAPPGAGPQGPVPGSAVIQTRSIDTHLHEDPLAVEAVGPAEPLAPHQAGAGPSGDRRVIPAEGTTITCGRPST